jgi:hypothetical protein
VFVVVGKFDFGFESLILLDVLGWSCVFVLSLSLSLWFLEDPVLSRDFDRDLDRVLELFFSYEAN